MEVLGALILFGIAWAVARAFGNALMDQLERNPRVRLLYFVLLVVGVGLLIFITYNQEALGLK